MSTYKISLNPTGKFFFGGEMQFSLDDKEDQFTSYIIKSKQLPQQTSLLGMLRFLILSNDKTAFNDGSIIDNKAATNLIGGNSFMINENHADNNFGKIKFITPCEIEDKNGITIEKQALIDPKVIDFNKTSKAFINGKEITIPEIEGFDAKKGTNMLFENIFSEDMRNGISKDYEGKSQDNAYYMQVSYRMTDQQRFVFYADVDIDLTAYDGQLVKLGADSSSFIVKIETANVPTTETSNSRVVILTSPAYLDANDLNFACFAITKTETFRFLKTTVETKSYNRRSREIKSSDRTDLYSAGSVFCFETEQKANEFKAALEAKKEFRQIGYNYYRTK